MNIQCWPRKKRGNMHGPATILKPLWQAIILKKPVQAMFSIYKLNVFKIYEL